MSYQAFVFTGRGGTPGGALQAALDAYAAWLTAQGADPRNPTIYQKYEGGPVVEVLPPLLHGDPAMPYACSISVVAHMRLPARAIEDGALTHRLPDLDTARLSAELADYQRARGAQH